MNYQILLVLLILLHTTALAPSLVRAQVPPDTTMHQVPADTAQVWAIRTADGNDFYGTIVEQTEVAVVLETQNIGVVTIPLDQVVRMDRVSEERVVNGVIWPKNPLPNRYFLGSNGIGLDAGEGYYQNIWVFFNQVTFTFVDNFSVGFGTVPFIASGSNVPFWIAPRLGIPMAGRDGKVHLGLGGVLGGILGTDGGVAGVAYGSLTFGDRNNNFSLGLGFGNDGDDWSEQPLITIGGMLRTGRRGYLMGETFLASFDGELDGFGLIGYRAMGRFIAFDAGFIFPVGIGEFGLLPWVGVSVPFGR